MNCGGCTPSTWPKVYKGIQKHENTSKEDTTHPPTN